MIIGNPGDQVICSTGLLLIEPGRRRDLYLLAVIVRARECRQDWRAAPRCKRALTLLPGHNSRAGTNMYLCSGM